MLPIGKDRCRDPHVGASAGPYYSKGTWRKTGKTWTTQGKAETRTINLPKGTYRTKVHPQAGWASTTSAAVTPEKYCQVCEGPGGR